MMPNLNPVDHHRRWRRLAQMVPQALATEPVPSPCQSVCVMHADSGWCEGCLRSLEEIGAWSRLDAAAKRAVWSQLPARIERRTAMEQS